MNIVVQATDQFELIWNIPKLINPADFPATVLSYFTLQKLDEASFEVQRHDKFYSDDWVFAEEVAFKKVSKKEIYGIVSGLNENLILAIRGVRFVVVYEWCNNQWVLSEFDDFNLREESSAMRRFKISADLENLKKALA